MVDAEFILRDGRLNRFEGPKDAASIVLDETPPMPIDIQRLLSRRERRTLARARTIGRRGSRRMPKIALCPHVMEARGAIHVRYKAISFLTKRRVTDRFGNAQDLKSIVRVWMSRELNHPCERDAIAAECNRVADEKALQLLRELRGAL